MAKRRNYLDVWSSVILFSLIMLDLFLWMNIIKDQTPNKPEINKFLLGKNNAELIVWQNNIRIMIDSGVDASVVQKIDGVLLSNGGRYIDLAFISYPAANNYMGYEYLLDHYDIGALIYDGRNDANDPKYWATFLQKINGRHIPLITLGKGDRIRYGVNSIRILAPNKDLARSADITQAALRWDISSDAEN